MSFISKLLAVPLGYIMKGCYWAVNQIHLPLAYVFALLLFTLVTKILLFPLMMKQQKSTAMMAIFAPRVSEIQKKYKNNPEKQNEELAKLQEEGYRPTAGCLPMIINLLIMFGLVEVIYRPLSFMLTLPSDLISSLTDITVRLSEIAGKAINPNDRMIETYIIQAVKTNFDAFSGLAGQYAGELAKISDLDMSIGNIHLYEKPVFALSSQIIIPIFSIITMLISTVFSMKASGTDNQEAAAQTKSMLITTSVMFAIFSFMYPMGFSLYWGFQNLISLLQTAILKKMYDPEEMKAALKEIEKQKKKERNGRKQITYTDVTGKTVSREVSADEAARIRLQRAREIDAERYGE